MKHIRQYKDFLNEAMDPEAAAMQSYIEGVNDIYNQMKELKNAVKDKPEEQGVVNAKIRVLQAKLMVIRAQKEVEREKQDLVAWKENEKLRKAAEKESERQAKEAEKERAAKLKARNKD